MESYPKRYRNITLGQARVLPRLSVPFRTVSFVPEPTRKIIMRARPATIGASLLLAAILGLVTACSDGASFADRMAYLKKMANEGVQTHQLVVSEGGTTTDKRCNDAYSGLQDNNPPGDQAMGGSSQGWLDQIQAFFVESCVTGLPKATPSQGAGTPSVPTASTVSASSSPTRS